MVGTHTGGKTHFVVGLTGGIASGKSTVSATFADLGAAIVDTDLIARAVVAPGCAALGEIAATFGPSILTHDGSLDRRKLREIVFAQQSARARLEAILHPRIRCEALTQVQSARGPYVVLVVPLLVENVDHYGWVDRVLVVDVARELQERLLMTRDDTGSELAAANFAAQVSRSERLARADDVGRNSLGFGDLKAQVRNADRRYRVLAAT
ncbi:MAG: dephospho-CoA kinase [Rhodocyclaceae bacterium]|nr:dephospho-CoA kinase [Rhodocyclaceae bacterium]